MLGCLLLFADDYVLTNQPRFQVLTAASMVVVFWVIVSSCVVGVCRRFKGRKFKVLTFRAESFGLDTSRIRYEFFSFFCFHHF
jgi:hypothetical protein